MTQTQQASSAKPPFPHPHRPFLIWPNTDSIRKYLLKVIDTIAMDRLYMDFLNEPVLHAGDPIRTAPGLDEPLESTLQEYDLPQELLEHLFDEQHFCAQQALEQLPPTQLEALIQTAAKRIESQGPV